MGIHQHYPRIGTHPPVSAEDGNYASLSTEMSPFPSSTFEPRQERIPVEQPPRTNPTEQYCRRPRPNEGAHELAGNRRKIGSTDVFGQNMENLVQIDDPANGRTKFAKSLDEIREEPLRRHAGSVLGLNMENLIVGLESSLQAQRYPLRNALRRNQSFDHTR